MMKNRRESADEGISNNSVDLSEHVSDKAAPYSEIESIFKSENETNSNLSSGFTSSDTNLTIENPQEQDYIVTSDADTPPSINHHNNVSSPVYACEIESIFKSENETSSNLSSGFTSSDTNLTIENPQEQDYIVTSDADTPPSINHHNNVSSPVYACEIESIFESENETSSNLSSGFTSSDANLTIENPQEQDYIVTSDADTPPSINHHNNVSSPVHTIFADGHNFTPYIDLGNASTPFGINLKTENNQEHTYSVTSSESSVSQCGTLPGIGYHIDIDSLIKAYNNGEGGLRPSYAETFALSRINERDMQQHDNTAADAILQHEQSKNIDLSDVFMQGNGDQSEDNSGSHSTLSRSHERKKKDKKKCPRCAKCCRPFYNFFNGPPDENIMLKILLGFPFGALFGLGLYYMIIEPMNLALMTRQIICGVLSIGLATGFALSVQVRCVSFLLIPTFFGKKGRSYVGTFAIVYLITGPVSNIILNGKEVTRSLSCAAELVFNHTASKWELRLKPVGDILEDIQKEGYMISNIVRKIRQSFQPIIDEIQGTSETKEMKSRTSDVDKISGGDRITEVEDREPESLNAGKDDLVEKRYRKKIDYRCEDVWNCGVLGCRKHFRSLERKCLNAIPIIGYILCLPLKLTFFCKLIKLIPGAIGAKCDGEDVVNPGFGETYDATDEMVEDMDRNSKINLQYKLVHTPEDIDVTTVEEVRKKTMHEFEQKQAWVEFVMSLMKTFLSFTFIMVFMSAYTYNKSYLSDANFDNMYITKYFRHIDARRRKRGKSTFLILVRALTAWLVIATDHLLYTIMDIIRTHSRIDYRQTGEHHIRVNVNGTGFMSDIIRLFLHSFNKKHSIDHVTTNFDCLPKPKKLETHFITMIYCVYITVWLLTFFEAYGLRLRRLITSFFYRKREKRRVLFFYNDMIKKRKGFLRHVRHEIRKQARQKQLYKATSVFHSFLKQFPRFCACLKRFEKSKDTCLICNDKEKSDFHHCQTTGCKFGYCAECWIDVKKRCYACAPADAIYDESELTEDWSTDS